VRLLQDFEPEPLPVQLLTLSRSNMAPKVRAFLDLAVKVFRYSDTFD
jgi:DNA-binding transcriptional LysR family regulator